MEKEDVGSHDMGEREYAWSMSYAFRPSRRASDVS